jgi:glycerol-3-phosphate dehydrogenase
MFMPDFSSGSCLIFPAQKSGGQIDLFVNSMVRTVTTNNEGKATGVSFIDKEDNTEYKLKGKVVVLAASACSSARFYLTQNQNNIQTV